MPRYKSKEYTLSRRKHASSTVWYYSVYNWEGKRVTKSTGIGYSNERDRARTRREAVAYCEELLKRRDTTSSPTLAEWVERTHFWDWEKSSYVKSILMRSGRAKPGITEGYCIKSGRTTEKYILPYHGRMKLQEITPYDCEQLLFLWADGASNRTANSRKYIYSTILSEYERELKMRNPRADYYNPWRMVKPLAEDKNRYGGLTVGEVQKLLALGADTPRDHLYFCAMKLALFTGLRIGEVVGLYTEDVVDHDFLSPAGEKVRLSYLSVGYKYDPTVKARNLTKDKETRSVPIVPSLREEIDRYITEPGRYLLSFHPRQERPLTANHVRSWFYKRLEEIGIDKDQRAARHIAFHSTRRFFNTLLRNSGVSDNVIRRFTGHDSEAMTEHYTDYLPEDLQNITEAQAKLIGKNSR